MVGNREEGGLVGLDEVVGFGTESGEEHAEREAGRHVGGGYIGRKARLRCGNARLVGCHPVSRSTWT